jgi:hypothetical protein
MEYLKYPINYSYLIEPKTWNTNQGDNWSYHFNNLKLHKFSDDQFFKRILEHYYRTGQGWKDLEGYFEKNWIRYVKLELDFLSGKDLKESELGDIGAAYLGKQVLIDIVDINKEHFKPDERVKLTVDLKNVPSLYIKVFEFNSLNYFKKTKQPFKTDVNLDGLIATKELIYDFKEEPRVKHREVFEFAHLDSKVGVFIIEFIANGFSSRATVKKGALSLVHKPTIAGQLAYIVNEDHQICCSEDTGIWYQNHFFKADFDKGGRILIPYEKYQTGDQAILVHEGFAHLENFTRLSEDYQFDTTFILHPESLVMGNEATLLIRPKLTLNTRTCDLKLLDQPTAILTTMTYVDNIPVTKTYDNLEVNEKGEIPIEFQVPPNLQYVDIAFECNVRNVTQGTNQKMRKQKTFNINTNTQNAKYYEAFLRRVKKSDHSASKSKKKSKSTNFTHTYYYYALGKNGEPLKNVEVNFNFSHSLILNNASSTLFTDKDGKIDLGPLDHIWQISSNFNSAYGSCSRSWNIPYLKEMIDYPEDIEILEDEPIDIPVPSQFLEASEISLTKFSENSHTIENMAKNLNLKLREGHGFGNLYISNLERGQYKLRITKLNIEINILVHEGVYWEAEGFVLKKNSIVEIKNEPNYLRIHSISMKSESMEERKENGDQSKLFFNLTNADENTRAHVFAFTFMPNQPHQEFKNMKSITASNLRTEVFPFTRWQNVYESNRKLGDEYKYVFNRKNAKRFIGNTLERPQLIMKRLKVRDTTFDSEVVKDGAAYAGVMADQEFAMKKKMAKDGGYGYGGYASFQNVQNSLLCQQNEIYGYQNFLKSATLVHKNLVPDHDGQIECDFDASKYTNILILATGEKSTTQVIYDIEDPADIEMRNLSLNDPLDHEKYFNEVRNTDNVYEGKVYNIQDITSTEYIFVDSLSKVKKVCDDI